MKALQYLTPLREFFDRSGATNWLLQHARYGQAQSAAKVAKVEIEVLGGSERRLGKSRTPLIWWALAQHQ
jgi:hypothetical protein